MNSKRLVVGIAALLLSALFFSSVFTEEAEAQVSGEMIAPAVAAVGGLFLGIGNVLNSLYASGLSLLLALGVLVDTIFTWAADLITALIATFCGMCPGFVADIILTIIGAIVEAIHGIINGFIDACLGIYTTFCAGVLGVCAGVLGICGGLCGGIVGIIFSLLGYAYTSIVGIGAFCVDFVGSISSMIYEGICGLGSGFFMTFAAVWICCAGLGVFMPIVNFCGGPICIFCGWIPGLCGGIVGAIADALTGGFGGFLG